MALQGDIHLHKACNGGERTISLSTSAITNPLLEVLVLADIRILMGWYSWAVPIRARNKTLSTPPVESDDDERLHNSKPVKLKPVLF